MPAHALRLAPLLLVLGACVPSYDPCFEPESVVHDNDLRVLGVRVDPPEALVDLAQDTPVPLQTRALVVGRPGSVYLVGRICVPTADLRCPDDGSQPLVGVASDDPAVDPTLDLTVPPALIRAARDADPLQGYGGIRVQLDLDAVSSGTHARASKLLLFNPGGPGVKANQPIELGRVDFTLQGQPAGFAAPGVPLGLQVGRSYGLRPRLLPLPDGSSPLEEYELTDLSGRKIQLREQVSYNFYATPANLFGDLQGANQVDIGVTGVYIAGADLADEPAEGVPEPPDGLVRFTPVKASIGHLYVVARESRGAVAWLALDVGTSDERKCGPDPVTGIIAYCPTLFFGCL